MALYHFHVTQIQRSAGQSAIACAAYRSGEKLYSEYYGETSDYTRKGGMICSDILLPPNAPSEYADRQALWNAVEKVERNKNAQLAYSFDIALQNELSLEENIALARQFLSEQLISRDMIVDYAIHEPDKEDDDIPNPHFHIRPLKENGKWGFKQRRKYLLDENGERIRDETGNNVFNAVPTTDWGSPETLEAWREAWANMVNAQFEEKGLDCRIDHRSYLRQGLDILPTVHEGPAVRQMEAKGITTNKGDLNRWIKATNALIRDLKKKIASLLNWLKELKQELSAPQPPNLYSLLGSYHDARYAGAWSQKAKIGNLKKFVAAMNYLEENKLYTLEDLAERIALQKSRVDSLKSTMDENAKRRKELADLLQQAENYARLKPVFDELNAIRWKGKKEKFKETHEGDLKLFYMARRKLKDHFTEDGKLPISAWRWEDAELEQKSSDAYAEFKPLRDDLDKLLQLRYCVNTAMEQRAQPDHQKSITKGEL